MVLEETVRCRSPDDPELAERLQGGLYSFDTPAKGTTVKHAVSENAGCSSLIMPLVISVLILSHCRSSSKNINSNLLLQTSIILVCGDGFFV
jgi:hypothetical protein